MTMQLSTAVINAMLDSVETTVGVSAKLVIFSGAKPTNCAAADPAGTLATIAFSSDWMANASAGSKALNGTQSGTASAAGTAASFRVYNNGLTTCHAQGTVTATGGGGDMTLDNTVLAASQNFAITALTLTDTANA